MKASEAKRIAESNDRKAIMEERVRPKMDDIRQRIARAASEGLRRISYDTRGWSAEESRTAIRLIKADGYKVHFFRQYDYLGRISSFTISW